MSQQDRQVGWVRSLQTFLWLQSHDPAKANNRVYTAIIDTLGRAGQLEVRPKRSEDAKAVRTSEARILDEGSVV